jgi:hypothetical protein
MGWAQWMRVFDTVSGLVQVAGRMRRPEGADPAALQASPAGNALGQIEARLAGVVVAALKEAFDRDSARLELERSQIESERRRAEEALRAEVRRQAADRLLGGLRLIAIVSAGTWGLSAALGGWQAVTAWSSVSTGGTDFPRHQAIAAAPWLLIAALLLTGTSLLIAL